MVWQLQLNGLILGTLKNEPGTISGDLFRSHPSSHFLTFFFPGKRRWNGGVEATIVRFLDGQAGHVCISEWLR